MHRQKTWVRKYLQGSRSYSCNEGSQGKVEESMELIRRAEELKRKEAAIPAAVAVAAVVAGQVSPRFRAVTSINFLF